MAAVEFRHVDIVFGQAQPAALAMLDRGASRYEVIEATQCVPGAIDVNLKVERGENAGRELAYTQVVTGRHILGMWDPQAGAHLKLPLDEVLTGPSNGAVILVQSEKNGLPGPIMGAASFQK